MHDHAVSNAAPASPPLAAGQVCWSRSVRLITLALGLQVAVLIGASVAVVVGESAGLDHPARAAVSAGLSVAIGALAGFVLLASLLRRTTDLLAPGIVAAGVVRALASLTLALVVFWAIKPEGRVFWGAFLAANLLCLFIESGWGILANHVAHGQRRHSAHPLTTAAAGVSA